jgi:hypothetical protein
LTVLDPDLRVVEAPDQFLRHLRFGRDGAESTTEMYAGATALFLRWCGEDRPGVDDGARHLGMFMVWLRHAPSRDDPNPVFAGPGVKVVRGPRRVNAVLAAVREFLKYAVGAGAAPGWVIGQLSPVGCRSTGKTSRWPSGPRRC